jgi:hypothetical protein
LTGSGFGGSFKLYTEDALFERGFNILIPHGPGKSIRPGKFPKAALPKHYFFI